MNQLSFKTVTQASDIHTVASLADEIWRQHYTDIIGASQVEYMLKNFQSVHAITEHIEKQGYNYWILVDENGTNVGYMATQPQEDHYFLSKLYIRQSYRNKGYGKQAVQKIIQVAKDLGFHEIRLGVNRDNRDSLRAYEKFGFKNLGHFFKDIGGGYAMDDYLMQIRF